MTAPHDLDRRLTAWYGARSSTREPDGLLASAMERIDHTRQRPRWLASERWHSMSTLTMQLRPRSPAVPVLIIIGTLVVLALIVYAVGSHRSGFPANGGIVYARAGDLYLVTPTGDRDLTSGGGAEQGVSFAPDGSRMVFWSQAADKTWTLEVAEADGTAIRTIAPTQHFVPTYPGEPLEWSPDGRSVALSSKVDGVSRVLVVDVGSGQVRDIAGSSVPASEEATWSHDGRSIAFRGALDASATAHALFVWDLASNSARRISPDLDPGMDAVSTGRPRWSPDDRTIVFDATETGAVNPVFAIYAVGSDGGRLQRLTPPGRNGYTPKFSPDGRLIAFAEWQDPVSSLWVMASDGSGQRMLRDHVVSDSFVWSPDGSVILFEIQPTIGDNSLYSIRPDGTGLTLLSSSTASDPRAGLAWQPEP